MIQCFILFQFQPSAQVKVAAQLPEIPDVFYRTLKLFGKELVNWCCALMLDLRLGDVKSLQLEIRLDLSLVGCCQLLLVCSCVSLPAMLLQASEGLNVAQAVLAGVVGVVVFAAAISASMLCDAVGHHVRLPTARAEVVTVTHIACRGGAGRFATWFLQVATEVVGSSDEALINRLRRGCVPGSVDRFSRLRAILPCASVCLKQILLSPWCEVLTTWHRAIFKVADSSRQENVLEVAVNWLQLPLGFMLSVRSVRLNSRGVPFSQKIPLRGRKCTAGVLCVAWGMEDQVSVQSGWLEIPTLQKSQ